MPTLYTLVTTNVISDVPADYDTNTVWHNIQDSIWDPSTGYQNHANEIRDLFSGQDATHNLFQEYAGRTMKVTVYDIADPLPRPERAVAMYTPSAPIHQNDLGPRQVALVLAFYGTRNLPSQRGHIYIGPYTGDKTSTVIPDAPTIAAAIDLGHGLFDIGGEDVAHIVRSRKLENNTVVQNYWVQNKWDTQRRRLGAATSRTTLAP